MGSFRRAFFLQVKLSATATPQLRMRAANPVWRVPDFVAGYGQRYGTTETAYTKAA